MRSNEKTADGMESGATPLLIRLRVDNGIAQPEVFERVDDLRPNGAFGRFGERPAYPQCIRLAWEADQQLSRLHEHPVSVGFRDAGSARSDRVPGTGSDDLDPGRLPIVNPFHVALDDAK